MKAASKMKIEAGGRLKKARLAIQAATGITHAEFCRALGIGVTALSNYEVGRNWPSPALLIRLKASFGVTSDYIYTGSLEGLPTNVTKEIARMDGTA